MSNRPLSVLQVCDHLGWEGSRMHGVKRLFAWMLPRFDPARVRPALVSLRRRDLSEEPLERHGVAISYLHRSRFDPATLTALLKVIDQTRADVLHLHGYGATTFGRAAAALRHLPVVLHEHANLTDTPWFQKVADRALAPFTDVALAVSETTAEFLVKARKVPADKVRVAYLAAPIEEFGRLRSPADVAAARQGFGATPDDLLVGTITRLHDSKGNEYLVEAARRVIDRWPHVRFVLAGEGPLVGALEARARALELGDRFVFAGFVRDVAAALGAFDLVVFPSLWEGTPLTAFEALAAGKPIVSTDADGLLDVLTGGRDAVIVPRRDAAALAEAIGSLVDNPDERARLAAAARETGQRYDIGVFVRKMEQLYALLVEGPHRRSRRLALEADLSFLGTRPAPPGAARSGPAGGR